VAQRLGQAVADASHAFWPDAFSLLDEGRLLWSRVLSSRQITDAYLLALATANGGRLVTFDRGIAVEAVPGAAKRNLVTLA
jgi:predicted nucleic acid-binding protein